MISERIFDNIPPQMRILNMVIPMHPNALQQFRFKLERWKPYKAARLPTIHDVIIDVKQFPTVANF